MSARRLQLQSLLETALGSDKVYFQPPTNTKLVYPCIVYERRRGNVQFADNVPYLYEQGYTVTLIDPNPDSVISDAIISIPKTIHDRFFTAGNLNHDVYIMYY